MKRLGYFLLLLALSMLDARIASAQTSWTWSNPRPQGNDLYTLSIKNDSLAAFAGANGATMRKVGTSFLSPVYPTSRRLLGLTRYVDTLWVTGDSGTIYRSLDNGATWTNKSVSANWISIASAAAFSALRVVIVGDSGYAYYTTDGGGSWARETNTNHLRMNSVKLDSFTAYAVTNSGYLLVGNNTGAFGWISEQVVTNRNLSDLSLTHSDMWIVGDSGSGTAYIQHRSTLGNILIWDSTFSGVSSALKSVVFTGNYVVAVGTGGVVVRSSDAGVTWTLPSSGTTEDLLHIDSTADPNHLGTLIAVGKHGAIVKSTNYGQTWIRLDSGVRAQVLALAKAPNGMLFGTSNGGNLYSSSNGGASWRRDSINGNYNQLLDIQFERTGFGLIATNAAGVLVTTDTGHTWVAHTFTGTQILGVATTLDSIGVAVGATGVLMRTTNKGATWTAVSSTSTKNLYDADFFGKFGVIAGYGGALLYSSNAGASWATASSAATGQLNRVRMATASNGVAVGVVGNIWRTTDYGQHWSSVTSPTTGTLRDIAWHDNVNGMIVGDAGKIYKTTDGGLTWTADASHVDQNLYAAMITSGTTAFVGGDQGTILTTNNSLLPVELLSLNATRLDAKRVLISWDVTHEVQNAGFSVERIDANGISMELQSIAPAADQQAENRYNMVDGAAPVSDARYRVWQHDLNGSVHELGTVSVEALNAITSSSSLVYPNPAHTTLHVSAPAGSTVTLTDLLGRVLTRDVASVGTSQFDVHTLANGTYLIVVSNGGSRESHAVAIVH